MPDEIHLRQEIRDVWDGQDPFAAVRALTGTTIRAIAARSTIRFEMNGRAYYAKRHAGVGWAEILKNCLTLRAPVVDASNEYRAAARLRAAGLDTLEVAAYGRRGRNPARRESFLITDEIAPVESLEQLCLCWPEQPPSVADKRRLIDRVAGIAATMHGSGVNHRDFYICHLLLRDPETAKRQGYAGASIHVVDLHRAQLRRRVPTRWLVKDLGGLWFSAMDIGITRRDRFRFLMRYFDRPLREVLAEHDRLLQRVDRRAHRLYDKARRKGILSRQMAGLKPVRGAV